MHDQYGFNLQKCNSASTLSGCIERDISRVIIALPLLMRQLVVLNKQKQEASAQSIQD